MDTCKDAKFQYKGKSCHEYCKNFDPETDDYDKASDKCLECLHWTNCHDPGKVSVSDWGCSEDDPGIQTVFKGLVRCKKEIKNSENVDEANKKFMKCMSCYKYPGCAHEDMRGKYMATWENIWESTVNRNMCVTK